MVLARGEISSEMVLLSRSHIDIVPSAPPDIRYRPSKESMSRAFTPP